LLEIFKLDVSLKVYLAIITGHLYKKGLVLYSKLWIEAVKLPKRGFEKCLVVAPHVAPLFVCYCS
jgi:hypothetical protein